MAEIKTVNTNVQSYGQNVGFGISNVTPDPVPPVQNINPVVQPVPFAQQQMGFANFIPINRGEEAPMPNPVGFNPSALVYTPDYVPQPVGLYMNNLVNQVAPLPEEEIQDPAADVKFNGLVRPINPNANLTKFGIQPIPLDNSRSMLPKPSMNDGAHNSNEDQAQSIVVGGRKLNNWFTRLLDQRGQDYISSGKLSVDEVSKNAERILDDMIAGRIDYSKTGQYIIMPVVIETLISYCSNKLAINKAIQFALGYLYNDYTNKEYFVNDQQRMMVLASIDDSLSRNITQSISIVNQDIEIYSVLYSRLQYVNSTKNASSLFSLTNDLNNLKKSIRKRY